VSGSADRGLTESAAPAQFDSSQSVSNKVDSDKVVSSEADTSQAAPPAPASAADAETIAVIGAGRIGRALARRAAVAGFRVVLEDLFPTSLEAARREIRQYLDEAVSSASLTPQAAELAFARIDCATTIEDAARRARIVMETGPDEQESKLEMFCLLDRIVLPGTVIVSNCHALELTDTAAKAESIVGMYFSGEHAEIHCLQYTSQRALDVAIRLAGRMAASHTITRD
jgi:3-hydroxybutyryl-CoA dehydrogenase